MANIRNMSNYVAPWTASPFARALWPYVLVGVGFSLALHFLLEPFLPSLRSTWIHLYPLQAMVAAGALVIVMRYYFQNVYITKKPVRKVLPL